MLVSAHWPPHARFFARFVFFCGPCFFIASLGAYSGEHYNRVFSGVNCCIQRLSMPSAQVLGGNRVAATRGLCALQKQELSRF